MPRKGSSLKTLLQICLRSIVENIDGIWCKQYVDVFKEQGPYRYVLGPFNDLPSPLLNEIISMLKGEKKLKRHHFDLFVTPQLDTLDLSREQDDIGYPLDLVASRCPRFKALDLTYCQKIPRRVYQDVLPVLTELQSLKLSGTNCNDSTLFIIGAYLTKLRELDVTSCSVSDQGITGLCGGVDDLNRPSDRLGQCRQLVKLCIQLTKVTEQGIETALKNLPALQVLECSNSVGVIADLFRRSQVDSSSKQPAYHLRNLTCVEGTYESESLPVAVLLCPSVVKAEIHALPGLTDSDVLSLTNLRNLQELSLLGNTHGSSFDFEESIAPLLQVQGSKLKALSLAEVSNINVQIIVQFCPYLVRLELIMNRGFSRYWPDCIPSSKKRRNLEFLQHLTVVCCNRSEASDDIPGEHLQALLLSPQLKHVFLKGCQFLNDEMLLQVLKEVSWPRLEHLEMEQCNEVSEESVEVILKACDSLGALKMWECRLLTKQNAVAWNKLIKKHKWKMTVDWA